MHILTPESSFEFPRLSCYQSVPPPKPRTKNEGPRTFTPFPKNPVIAKFFRQIGRADELGSDMRNMMKFSRAYGGADPELIEGDVFRIVINVPESGTDKGITGQAPQQVTQQVMKLLVACSREQSRAELMQAVAIKDRVSFTRNYLDPAIEADLIEMTQPDSPKSPTQKYRLTEKGRLLLIKK